MFELHPDAPPGPSVNIPEVSNMLGAAQAIADSAVAGATAMASQLGAFVPEVQTSAISFTPVKSHAQIGSVSKPRVPEVPSVNTQPPPGPSIITVDALLEAMPLFDSAPPEISFPAPPTPIGGTAPAKSFSIGEASFPEAPSFSLPAIPSLQSLNIPSPSSINVPSLDMAFPTAASLVIPTLTFSPIQNLYSSELVDKVKSTLIQRLSGGTGLSAEVEHAIWNRGRDRESRTALLAERTLLEDRVSAGFSRPPGAVSSALDLIVQESQSKIIELSREIMIKQAELEQENLKASIQQTIALEEILIREHNNINQRAFEIAKYTQEMAIEIYKVEAAKFQTEVEAYKAYVQAWDVRVKVELSKLEIFKAQIEAEKLKGDINEQNIKIYTAQIEGLKLNAEIFKTVVEATTARLKGEELKISMYKADIEAYTATVQAKATEYTAYAEVIKGEVAKASVFDSQVKAYSSRIQGYAAASEVKIKAAELKQGVNELNIKKYEADIQAYSTDAQVKQAAYQGLIAVYNGETQMYLADIGLAKANAEVQIKEIDNVVTQNKYAADVGIANANITLESLKGANQTRVASMSAAGSILQAIGSSALSSINVSSGVSGNVSISSGYNESHNFQDQ